MAARYVRIARGKRTHCAAGLLLLAVALFVPLVVSAAEEVPLSLEDTIRRADAIVLGTVTGRQSRWGDASRRWMVTDYTLTVENVLYPSQQGEPIADRVVLTYWGGTIGNETQSISDLRVPVVGERLVMMLRPDWARRIEFSPVVGLNQGLFSIAANAGSVGPQTSVMLDSGGLRLGLMASGSVERGTVASASTTGVALPTFVNWLSSNITRIKAAPSQLRPEALQRTDQLMAGFVKTPSLQRSPSDQRASPADSRPPFQPTDAASLSAPQPDWRQPVFESAPSTLADRSFQYVTLGPKPNLPIVVNNLPASFTPWSPEDQYQMAKWNYYAAGVFKVYTTPTDTFAWGDNVFDLDGWVSSSILQSVYGSPWGATTIGITFTRSIGGTMIEADIALNPAFGYTLNDESVYNGSSAQGFRLGPLHELGHMLGLDHNFNGMSVMNYFPSVFRFFAMPYMDDAAGIRALYHGNAVSRTDLGVYLYYSSGSQNATDATYPSSVMAGGSLTVNNVTIENVGTATIATPTIEWYLTTARNFDSSYYHLGDTAYSPALPPFTSYNPASVQRTLTIPTSVPAGIYYLGAFVRNDEGAGQSGFPFSNNFAFSRTQIAVSVTQGVAPTVFTGAANGIGSTLATLNGTANPNGTATNGFFEDGTTTGYGASTPIQSLGSGNVAVVIGGGNLASLTCNTQYHFRAKAINASGPVTGLDATFTTAPCPVQLTVAVTGATTIRLSWTATAGAVSYRVKRSTLAGGEVFLTSTGSTSLVDTVSTGAIYYYVVSAFNSSESPNSNEVSATAGRAVVSDFTGDFRADLGTFNPKTGTWAVTGLANQGWGIAGDILVPADYIGAGRVQVAIFRPSNGYWYVNGGTSVQWGQAGDIPVPGDYTGAGRAQVAVFRPSNGYWYVNGGPSVQWGIPGDIPVPADYDGDGKVDIAVFRPSNGYWFVRNGVSQPFGRAGDIPVPADYSGDGKADFAFYRPSTVAGGPWWSVNGLGAWTIGSVSDLPVPQDLDGDGRAELAVYRPAAGAFYSYAWSLNTWQTAAAAAGQVPLALPVALRKGIGGDVDRDRRRDPAVFRPSDGRWSMLQSASGYTTSQIVNWGASGDVPVAGDYDGDGLLDPAVYRPSNGYFWILDSASGFTTWQGMPWGISGDIPVAGDFDGDGRADITIYRPSTGAWWSVLSSGGYRGWSWGLSTDVPISGDFDGDGQTDITVYRPSNGTWWALLSSTGYTLANYRSWTWGASGEQPVVGDYDGDGITDVAMYRPADGAWRILLSSSGFTASRTLYWGGGSGWTFVPGDYDGDGKTDVGLWAGGTWYVLQSSSDFTTYTTYAWGSTDDVPIPKR